MKTTIEFKDGHVEVHEDLAPMVSPEAAELSLVDTDMGCQDELSLVLIKRIIWENGDEIR